MAKYYKIKRSSDPKKATAWKWFAKYIKLRDAIKTTGDVHFCRCITCGEIKPIEDMDAGHAISGRTNSILFDELLCNAQCRKDNRYYSGQPEAYKRVMIERVGQEMWDYLVAKKNIHVEYSQFDYEQISKLYRQKYKELLKNEKTL